MIDNTTSMSANQYDTNINNVIPYYHDFYEQTLEVINGCGFDDIKWMDLGCGTGTLAKIAAQHFPSADFVLVDPSEQMLDQARLKLAGKPIEYICKTSSEIDFQDRFDVVTAIQSHHYMHEDERKVATEKIYQSLKAGGIYITFENVVPEDEIVKQRELLRWGAYQQRHGKTAEEARLHNARCGVNYFPLTVQEHIQLLKNTGFSRYHVFWYSYMQMGIYGLK